jgi:hypothetical protein
VVLLSTLCVTGCVGLGPALQQRTTDNPAYTVEYLFSYDACRVYRFHDAGIHYFVRCDAAAPTATALSRRSCGRGCIQDEAVASTMVTRESAPSPPRP